MNEQDFIIKLVPRKHEIEPIKEMYIPPIIPQDKEKDKELEKEQKKIEKEQREQEIKIKKSLIEILNFWNYNLKRQHEGNPKPFFPLHPQTHQLVNPLDIFKVLEKIFNYEDIEIPSLILILVLDLNKLINIYELFKHSKNNCHDEICNLFNQKITFINNEWEDIIFPKINKEFVENSIRHLQKKYHLTINELSNDINIDENVIKIYQINNLNSLIKEIKIHPQIIYKISDIDLKFFNLNETEILKIRIIFAEKNKSIRNKLLDEFLKSKLTKDLKVLTGGINIENKKNNEVSKNLQLLSFGLFI